MLECRPLKSVVDQTEVFAVRLILYLSSASLPLRGFALSSVRDPIPDTQHLIPDT
jgi:hypothetical protein